MYGKVTGYNGGGGSGGPVNWGDILNKPSNLETTEGSQSKANTAESNAKSYADDLVEGIQAGTITWQDILNKPTDLETTGGAQTKATQALNDAKSFTNTQISAIPAPTWNSLTGKPTDLETTSGAQTKATTAETNAKSYADTNKLALSGGVMTGAVGRQYTKGTHYNNIYMHGTMTSGIAGAIKITLPKAKPDAQIRLKITGGIVGTGSRNWELTIAGGLVPSAPNAWTTAKGMLMGDAPFTNVYLGFDGTNACILLGDTSVTWSLRSFAHITELDAFGVDNTGWEAGWSSVDGFDSSTITTKLTLNIDKIANTAYVDTKVASASGAGLNLASYGVVNDGVTSDTAGLRAYIADMQSKGKPVIIPASKNKYIIDDTILIQTPTHIIGEGDGTWIHSTINNKAPIKFLNTNNCSIKNLKISSLADTRVSSFQGAVTIQTCDQILAENLTIDGTAATGFFITDSTNIKIHSNRVLNTLADGIHTTSKSKNVIVSNNHCINTGDDSISTVSYQSQGAQCENIVITNNSVAGAKARGITNIGSSHVVIDGNTINGTASCGILSHRDSNPDYNTYESIDTIITNNIVRSAGSVTPNVGNQNGIELGYSTTTKIAGNTVESSLHRGIAILEGAKDVTLSNNDSNMNQIAGYLISAVTGVSADLNRARGNGEQGVLIINTTYSTFAGFHVYDSASVVSGKNNIHIENSSYLNIGDMISLDTRTTQVINRALEIINSNNIKHGKLTLNKGTRPVYSTSCSNIDAYPFDMTTAIPTTDDFKVFKKGQKLYQTTDNKFYEWNGTAWLRMLSSADMYDGTDSTSSTQIASAKAVNAAFQSGVDFKTDVAGAINAKNASANLTSASTKAQFVNGINEVKSVNVTPGDEIVYNDETSYTGAVVDNTIKSVRINVPGRYRIFYDMRSTGSTSLYGQLFLNSTFLDEKNMTSATFTTYSYDMLVDCKAGDIIYLKGVASPAISGTATFRRLRLGIAQGLGTPL